MNPNGVEMDDPIGDAEIEAAAFELLRLGRRPSVRAVWKQIGNKCSHTRLHAVLKDWRARMLSLLEGDEAAVHSRAVNRALNQLVKAVSEEVALPPKLRPKPPGKPKAGKQAPAGSRKTRRAQ